MPVDDVLEYTVKLFADKLLVAGEIQIGPHRLEEPQRCIDSVELRRFITVGKAIGQHALVQVLRKCPQDSFGDI